MASELVRSGGTGTKEKVEAGRAAFAAWLARRLEWERLLRRVEAERAVRAAA